jgi:hypothetical protein
VTNDIVVFGTDITRHKLEFTNAIVTCDGAVIVQKAALNLVGSIAGRPSISCQDGFLLTNGAAMTVQSGPTNGVSETEWSASLTSPADFRLLGNSVLYLLSQPVNGGGSLVSVRDLTVAGGSSVNANGGGFAGRVQATGYGPGGGYNYRGGGGYGGVGGQLAGSIRGGTYGSSNAPIAPGSAGGTWMSATGHRGCDGGGSVRVEASRTITVDGTITADGRNTSSPGNTFAGGSGGGVYLRCKTIEGSTGVINARGGSGPYANGGGGRIAVWSKENTFSGTASASGGTAALSDSPGNGTIVWGVIPPSGTVVILR